MSQKAIKGVSLKEHSYKDVVLIVKDGDISKTIPIHSHPLSESAEQRIILLLSSSGVGKSTFKETMRDMNYIGQSPSGFSRTQDPTTESFIMNGVLDDEEVRMNLTIMDTPGIYEAGKGDYKVRSNEDLFEIISQAISSDLININLILICHRYGTVMSEQDINSLRTIQGFIGDQGKAHSGLLLTECEMKHFKRDEQSESDVEIYIQNLKSSDNTREVMTFFGDRIYPIGANDYNVNTTSLMFKSDFQIQMKKSVCWLRHNMFKSIYNKKSSLPKEMVHEVRMRKEEKLNREIDHRIQIERQGWIAEEEKKRINEKQITEIQKAEAIKIIEVKHATTIDTLMDKHEAEMKKSKCLIS